MASDILSFSLHANNKSSKNHEAKFIIAISKNTEPLLSKNMSPLSHLGPLQK